MPSRRRLIAASPLLALPPLAALAAAQFGGGGGRRTPPPPPADSRLLKAVAAQRGVRFGMAVNRPQLERPELATFIAQQSGIVVPEVELKMALVQPSPGRFDFAAADRIAAFAAANGLSMRGHTFVWHRPTGTPGWLADAIATPRGLRTVLEHHIGALARRYDVTAWDVANEVVAEDGRGWRTDSAWYAGAGGIGYVAQAFEVARELCPKGTKLAYCDFGTEAGNWSRAKRRQVLTLLESLASRGLVDVFAAQCHVTIFRDGYRFDQDAWASFLKEVMALGLQVNLTEMDVAVQTRMGADERAARIAEIVRLILEPWIEARAGDELLVWGVRDDLSWRFGESKVAQNPLPWDPSFRPNAMERSIKTLLGGAAR